jgi:hypothetical protein
MVNVRADEQEPHIRLSLRVSGHDIKKPRVITRVQGDRVNAAAVHGRFTFLFGEICLRERQVGRVSAITGNSEAPCVATCRMSRQKSAEGIVP